MKEQSNTVCFSVSMCPVQKFHKRSISKTEQGTKFGIKFFCIPFRCFVFRIIEFYTLCTLLNSFRCCWTWGNTHGAMRNDRTANKYVRLQTKSLSAYQNENEMLVINVTMHWMHISLDQWSLPVKFIRMIGYEMWILIIIIYWIFNRND